ncbi:MAG: endolytic transglycosylase MltG [Candidatus Colwellbacteria bacterium]|nr:endolytic transglycosylase MltG [Candidatus Colwellbacteria bacterium]
MRLSGFTFPFIVLGILGGGILAYTLAHNPVPKTVVTVPEGATHYEINELLKAKGVLVGEELPESLEGYLFPDTYEFFVPSDLRTVQSKFEENFNRKIGAIIPQGSNPEELKIILTKASLIEKEVPDPGERRIAAGIMVKRLENDVPLQMDASLCYLKKEAPCLPITEKDKASDSPFNTYRYQGLPPHPIANPGLDAVRAVLNPTPTPYWFYLSDPQSKKTVFSKTLDEHNDNIVKYLNTTN